MNYDTLSEPLACKEALRDYTEMNDPVVNFWNEIRNEVRWNLLPFTFLYDLYKSWFVENKPTGSPLGKTTFMVRLEQVVETDPNWFCKGRFTPQGKAGDSRSNLWRRKNSTADYNNSSDHA